MADDTEKLIDLVREFGFLYDPRHPDYKDVVKKAAAWKYIGEKQQLSSDAVKIKWKNLRDSYVKYLKFLNGAPGSSKKFKNWPWATNMEFLHDAVSPKIAPSIVNPLSQVEVVQLQEESSEEGFETDDSQMPPPKKKSKPNDVSKYVQSILKYLEKKRDNKPINSLDRTDHLFLSYAETFKKFSPRTQALLKMEMAEMFGRAELANLENPTPSLPFDSNSPT